MTAKAWIVKWLARVEIWTGIRTEWLRNRLRKDREP